MLAEFLEGRGDWAQVMPGARACLFSLHDEPVSLPLRLEPPPLRGPVLPGRVNYPDSEGQHNTDGIRSAGTPPH